MKQDSIQLLNYVAQALYDKKGFNIIAIDVRSFSSMTDFFLIAEGNVDRHVMALGKTVTELFSEYGQRPIYTEGLKTGDWIVLDYLEIVVHIFTPDMRDKYRLEELWQQGTLVELDLIQKEQTAL